MLAIKAENISKQYRLGQIGTGTLSHDLNRTWHRIRGKEDPYLKIGEANDRSAKGESEYVWSLRDIDFEIEQGDAVGIIGRNGAGKSTLLKLLSKVTKPTTGHFKVNGRIASLLEVGTGFNLEMTGRENIFLNGAILGMRRNEIRRKFDEIVEFSGVSRYIDTPVKRYSSGMYVRLAFGWELTPSALRELHRTAATFWASMKQSLVTRGSWVGSLDHTHASGGLALPLPDVVARRFQTM